MSTRTPPTPLLIQLLCQLSDPRQMERALHLLLTPKEQEGIENRLKIFRLLAQHEPQRDIATALNVGIATVTRGASAYRNNTRFVEQCLKQIQTPTVDKPSPQHAPDDRN